MSSVAVNGNYCYVALQRLVVSGGYFIPGDLTGLLVVIDTRTDAVVDTISLGYKNPQDMVIHEDMIYVSCTGNYGVLDGGLQKIDPSTKGVTTILTEAQCGGDISYLKIFKKISLGGTVSQICYLSVSDLSTYAVVVKKIDLLTNTVGDAAPGVTNGFGGLAYDGTYVYIGDQGDKYSQPAIPSGVVVVDPVTNTQVGSKIAVGLPPVSIAVLSVE
jgi:hypothetical protein